MAAGVLYDGVKDGSAYSGSSFGHDEVCFGEDGGAVGVVGPVIVDLDLPSLTMNASPAHCSRYEWWLSASSGMDATA